MACDHKSFRCTNNRFFCLVCGAEITNPYEVDKHTGQEEKPVETQKSGRKRKAKKEVET